MLDKSIIQKLKLISDELESQNYATLAEPDVEALEMMIADGYTSSRILEIVNSEDIRNNIRNNKVFEVKFDKESKKQIKLCVENQGRVQGAAVAINKKVPAEDFIACTFAEGEIAGVILLDNYNVVLLRNGIETPLTLTMQNAEAARLLFDETSKLI